MEAKDTVMSNKQLEKEIRKDYPSFIIKEQTEEIEDILYWTREAQAEITWKARDPEVEEARQAGRREVVEIVNGFMVLHSPISWRRHLEDWELVEFYEKDDADRPF